MKRKKAEKQITITGIVTASDWDEDDNITAVTISTHDEKEYRVSPNAKGKELLGFIQQQVQATGVVGIDEDGRQVIAVKKYEVLEKENNWNEKDEWD